MCLAAPPAVAKVSFGRYFSPARSVLGSVCTLFDARWQLFGTISQVVEPWSCTASHPGAILGADVTVLQLFSDFVKFLFVADFVIF